MKRKSTPPTAQRIKQLQALLETHSTSTSKASTDWLWKVANSNRSDFQCIKQAALIAYRDREVKGLVTL